MRRSLVPVLSLAALGLFVGCVPTDFESGAADLTLTPGEETPLQLIHESGLSTVRVTPPVDGEVELSFTYNDPLVDLTLRADSNEVSEGDVVQLPAPPEALSLTVIYDGVEYGSGEGSSGTVAMQALFVEDDTGAADVSALIEATLVASDGATLAVDGFVEGGVPGTSPPPGG